jgi:hypothetical protein
MGLEPTTFCMAMRAQPVTSVKVVYDAEHAILV